MLQQKVVKTGSQNWHRATCADNSGEVEKLRRECMGQGRGGKERTCMQRSAAPERDQEELCPPAWPGLSCVLSLGVRKMAHCVPTAHHPCLSVWGSVS